MSINLPTHFTAIIFFPLSFCIYFKYLISYLIDTQKQVIYQQINTLIEKNVS